MQTTPEAPGEEPRTLNGTESGPPPAADVRLDAVGHGFGQLDVLGGLAFETSPGEVVGLVGPSGCGKSTLLELVAGLGEPRDGTISVGGADTAGERLRRCAYMPQRDLLLPWLSAIDNAGLALRNRGAKRADARAAAAPLFAHFGLAGFERALPTELSGGMRQRVAFLRTLLAGKPVLLLDEPFASLDAITRAEMQEWLAQALEGEGRTVLLVTHDVEEALYLCDRVLVMSARPGRIVAEVAAPSPRSIPRDHAVAAAEFVAARTTALDALRQGSR
jgi:NitT/TauT family transport system ATP-binding protein